MKLTKYQKARLLEYDWDVVNADDGQNCNWIEVNKHNNEIFSLIVDLFGLTGENNSVKLLVVATNEGE